MRDVPIMLTDAEAAHDLREGNIELARPSEQAAAEATKRGKAKD